MLSIIITIVLLWLSLYLVYAVRAQVKWRSAYKLPPSLPGELPIIGHTLNFIVSGSKDTWSLIKGWSDYAVEKGGVVHGWILGDVYYIITDPEDALTVANSCLQKHFVYEFAKNWLGEGLLTSSGEANKHSRKLLGSWFTAATVHTFLNIFNNNAKKLADDFNSFRGKEPFDPTAAIKRIALDTFCLTTFGSNIKDSDFIQNYSNAVNELLDIYTKRFTKGYLQSNLMYKLLGHQKKEDQLINTLNKLTNKVIQQKKAAIQNDNINGNHSDLLNNQDITHKPLVDYMLKLDGLVTDEEIKQELDTNVASSDTFSKTLINMVVLLGSYPKVQDRIYEELMEVLGAEKDVEKDDLQKLIYTKAVIKESLRILPTVPIIARYIDKDVKLKNYTMAAKSQCAIMPYGINRSAAWGPDAEQFKPERWLDPASLPSISNCFAGFSIGRRSCIGMTYGITQLSVILAHLVRQCQWTTDFTKVKMQLCVTLQPKEGHEITTKRRT